MSTQQIHGMPGTSSATPAAAPGGQAVDVGTNGADYLRMQFWIGVLGISVPLLFLLNEPAWTGRGRAAARSAPSTTPARATSSSAGCAASGFSLSSTE
jgi:hypothetical protein